MRRSSTSFLAIVLTIVTAVTFVQAALAIGASRPPGGSPNLTQAVRTHYLELNTYLQQTNGLPADPLASIDLLSGDASVGMPWLAALRSTYPHLRFDVSQITSADDLALVRVTFANGDAVLPPWINGESGPPLSSAIDALQFADGALVEWTTSARTGPLAQSLAGADSTFRLDAPAFLTVAALDLRPGDASSTYVAVPGPGMVIPLEGAFIVTGNQLAQVADPSNGTRAEITAGAHAVVSGEQVLVIPRGHAVLRPSDERSGARLLLLSMMPVSPEPRDSEVHRAGRGREALGDIMRRLSVEQGIESTWFGSIELLAVAQDEVRPGWLSMDLTRLVVPAGERVMLDPFDDPLLVLSAAEGAAVALVDGQIDNLNHSIRMFEVVRVCWLGSGTTIRTTCMRSKAA